MTADDTGVLDDDIEIPSTEEVASGIKLVSKEFPYFTEKYLRIDEDEPNHIIIEYPGFRDPFSMPFIDFIYLVDELRDFKIINEGKFCTTYQTVQAIQFSDEDEEFIALNQGEFEYRFDNGLIRIDKDIDIINFYAIKNNTYSEEYGIYNDKPVVQIIYDDRRNKLSDAKEYELISTFLFEINDSYNYDVSLSRFYQPDKDKQKVIEELVEEEEGKERKKMQIRPIINFNEGMKLFLSASQVSDQSLKFLNYYKIIEFFAPIIVRLNGNEQLASKLNSPKVFTPDKNFLDEIFELVNSVNSNQRDSELPKVVLHKVCQ